MARRLGRIGASNRSRFQTALAVCLLGVALLSLFASFRQVAEEAERQQVRLMLNQFRSALVIKGAEVQLSQGRLSDWQGINPVTLLAQAPAQWAGECARAPLKPPAPGIWCFDAPSGQVVYTPKRLEAEPSDNKSVTVTTAPLAWRVVVEYAGQKRRKDRRPVGLKLIRVKFGEISGDDFRDHE